MICHRVKYPVTLALWLGLITCTQPSEVTTTGFIVNGLKVIFRKVPGSPIVAAGFYLKGGANYVGPNLAGIEPFLFETAVRGTETRTKTEINTFLESTGTVFRVVAEYDYSGLIIQSRLDQFTAAWELFADVLLHPRLEPHELELVRQKITTAIGTENDRPERQVQRLVNDLYYTRHPYGISLYGTASSIKRLTRNDLIQYHREDLTKNRAGLVIVGDLDLKEVTAMARELARRMPTGPQVRLPTVMFNPGRAELAVANRRLPTNLILGLFAAPRPGHPDYPAFTIAMQLLSDRLFQELRTERSLADDPSAAAAARIANHGVIRVTTTKPEMALKAVLAVIDRMIAQPVNDQQLEQALAVSVTRYRLKHESILDQLEQLAMWELVGEGWEKADQYLREIPAVKPVHIRTVMRRYVRDIHFGVVGNPALVPRALVTGR
ncbi:MAG: insulinase family protein [Candidatus Marinimicrobia bacterium]|nr:insulinase family protein [Candidatus Neomarinimicrobiota bacterium]